MDQSWHLGCIKNTYNGPLLKLKSGAFGKEMTREGGGVGWEWERK